MNPSSLDVPPRVNPQMRATSGANLFASATRLTVTSAPREAEVVDSDLADAVERNDQLVADDNNNDDDEDDAEGDFMYVPLAAPPGVATDTVKRTDNTNKNNNIDINININDSNDDKKETVANSNAVGSTAASNRLQVRTNARPSSGEYMFVGNDSALISAFKHQVSAPNLRPADGSYVAIAFDPTPSAPMPQYEHVPNIIQSTESRYVSVEGPPPDDEFATPGTMHNNTGTIPAYQPMAMLSESSDALVLSDEEGGDDDGPAPPIGKARSRPMLQRTRADKQLVFGTSRRSTSGSRLVVTVMVPSLDLAKRVLCDAQTTCGAALEKMVGGFKIAGLVSDDFNARDYRLSHDPIAFALLPETATMGASLGVSHGNAPSPLYVVRKANK